MTSTAGNALLTVADTSATATGHMVNGSFALPQPLQVKATTATQTGDYAAVGGSSPPTQLLSSKTLTFTLSTTAP